MERFLLWVSLAVGVVVYLIRFLPVTRTSSSPDARPGPALHPGLRVVALAAPLVGWFATLPNHPPFFSPGQKLGLGFLIGGVSLLLGQLGLVLPPRSRPSARPVTLLCSGYGSSIVAVGLALLLLRQSLLDGLMGIALGGFAVGCALFLGLPNNERSGAVGRRVVTGVGFLVTLATAAALTTLRDSLTPELAKLTWSGLLLAFAALGTLLTVGSDLLGPERMGRMGRLAPLVLLIVVGGVGMYELSSKVVNTALPALLAIGGLLLWPVALAVLREGVRRAATPANPLLAVPLLAVLVLTSGFLAALQTLQGTGVAVGVLALHLAYPATFALAPGLGAETTDEYEACVPVASVGLLLFATLLLLWRFFVTRWTDDLRGVNLSDQYALFGLLVGAALPGLLAALPSRANPKQSALGAAAILGITTALALLAPAVVLALFGAKSAVALLIGLALGSVPLLAVPGVGASLLPGLLALAVALALDQWTGRVLPEQAPTRAEKLRWLIILVAGLIVVVLAAAGIGRRSGASSEEGTEQ